MWLVATFHLSYRVAYNTDAKAPCLWLRDALEEEEAQGVYSQYSEHGSTTHTIQFHSDIFQSLIK